MPVSDGFFIEEQTPNVCFGYRVRRTLLSKRTAYQQLDVVETEDHGRLLALDGRIMLTERDERFYHEMLVHPPLLTHPSPRRVMVVGGGDGGAIREVLQHPSVDQVIWAEIDGDVISAAREYLPTLSARVFDDPRVSLRIEPGEDVINALDGSLDVIIVDSTDPIGAAVPLFQASFYRACARVLGCEGIYATHCGSPFHQPQDFAQTANRLRTCFPHVRFHLGFVPCYPAVWSYCMASATPLTTSADMIRRRYQERRVETCYLTPELYESSGVLPAFVQRLLSNG